MKNIHPCEIKKILASFDIESLAISSGFKMRSLGKISAHNFLPSFFIVMLGKCFSLRLWAFSLSSMINDSVTFQAIAKRLNARSLAFVQALIQAALSRNAAFESCIAEIGGLSGFTSVLIEDSTCVKMPTALFSTFPGTKNQGSEEYAIARIQLCIDIKNGDYRNFDLTSYRKNDHTYADSILSYLRPNDLVVRDLGYSSINVFNQIAEKEAFFISRINNHYNFYSIEDGEAVDLLKILKKVETRQLTTYQTNLAIGVDKKFKCRIVCTKLPVEQVQQRLKQRTKGRIRNKKLSKKTKYLMGWNILMTNIDGPNLSLKQLFQLYSLRWHIELVFKTWKSYFKIDAIMKSCQGPNRVKPEILLSLCLCFIIVVVNPQFKMYQKILYDKFGKFLSPMKFCKTLLNQIFSNFNRSSEPKLLQLLLKNCCYDIRSDRKHIYEKIIYF